MCCCNICFHDEILCTVGIYIVDIFVNTLLGLQLQDSCCLVITSTFSTQYNLVPTHYVDEDTRSGIRNILVLSAHRHHRCSNAASLFPTHLTHPNYFPPSEKNVDLFLFPMYLSKHLILPSPCTRTQPRKLSCFSFQTIEINVGICPAIQQPSCVNPHLRSGIPTLPGPAQEKETHCSPITYKLPDPPSTTSIYHRSGLHAFFHHPLESPIWKAWLP